MLSALFVSQLALIRRLNADLESGMTVLTGETGAGKSLILDSLALFLSSDSPKELVRYGAEKMEVSLLFQDVDPRLTEEWEELSGEEAGEITLSRSVTPQGKSVTKLNGRTLPFSRASALAARLLALHGQHATVGLLDERNHLKYLDEAVAQRDPQSIRLFREQYERFLAASQRLEELQNAEGDEETIALWDFQMKEIARVRPRIGEEEELTLRLERLRSLERDYGALHTALRALSGGEKGKGAVFLLEAAARKLEESGENSPFAATADTLRELAESAAEVRDTVSAALSELGEGDPAEEIDRIVKRLDLLYRLKLKYGKTEEEVLERYRTLKEKKDLTLSRKDDIIKAEAQKKEEEAALETAALRLSRVRRETADRLEREIHGILSFLDMPKLRFFVETEPLSRIGRNGAEEVRFVISPNTGEGKKPLAKVASGGELSRILLALQLKLGRGKDAETLVFDEIDTGISGATAQKIGVCLKLLSQRRQVICVTHSAQVASLADHHFLVEKREENERTETCLVPLDEEGSLRELARILGGRTITGEALSAARTLREEGSREWQKHRDFLE